MSALDISVWLWRTSSFDVFHNDGDSKLFDNWLFQKPFLLRINVNACLQFREHKYSFTLMSYHNKWPLSVACIIFGLTCAKLYLYMWLICWGVVLIERSTLQNCVTQSFGATIIIHTGISSVILQLGRSVNHFPEFPVGACTASGVLWQIWWRS